MVWSVMQMAFQSASVPRPLSLCRSMMIQQGGLGLAGVLCEAGISTPWLCHERQSGDSICFTSCACLTPSPPPI
ncbi:hypothetical protein ACSF6V_10090 [Escherichia coli]|uniref:hypothetical protein n=1 Tax=Escherichia coli TaxID=562 RepID=UPI003EED8409